jgi:hypothetical protein
MRETIADLLGWVLILVTAAVSAYLAWIYWYLHFGAGAEGRISPQAQRRPLWLKVLLWAIAVLWVLGVLLQ